MIFALKINALKTCQSVVDLNRIKINNLKNLSNLSKPVEARLTSIDRATKGFWRNLSRKTDPTLFQSYPQNTGEMCPPVDKLTSLYIFYFFYLFFNNLYKKKPVETLSTSFDKFDRFPHDHR